MNRILYGPFAHVPLPTAGADAFEAEACPMPVLPAPTPNAIAPMPEIRRKSRRELVALGRSSRVDLVSIEVCLMLAHHRQARLSPKTSPWNRSSLANSWK